MLCIRMICFSVGLQWDASYDMAALSGDADADVENEDSALELQASGRSNTNANAEPSESAAVDSASAAADAQLEAAALPMQRTHSSLSTTTAYTEGSTGTVVRRQKAPAAGSGASDAGSGADAELRQHDRVGSALSASPAGGTPVHVVHPNTYLPPAVDASSPSGSPLRAQLPPLVPPHVSPKSPKSPQSPKSAGGTGTGTSKGSSSASANAAASSSPPPPSDALRTINEATSIPSPSKKNATGEPLAQSATAEAPASPQPTTSGVSLKPKYIKPAEAPLTSSQITRLRRMQNKS